MAADILKDDMKKYGMGIKQVAECTGISLQTLEKWMRDERALPEYMIFLIEFQIKYKEENVMPVTELVDRVTDICRKKGVKHLTLFGSFATGTATKTSDIDFVVYGCKDMIRLEDAMAEIETLRKIDLFDYDSIHNEYLLEDIEKYGKQIY